MDSASAVRVEPLSFQQDELLRKLRRPPDASFAYDTLTAYRVEGALDDGHWRTSIGDLVRRHPSLRTVLGTDRSGRHRQMVMETLDVDDVLSHSTGPVESLWAKLLASRYRYDDIVDGRALFRSGVHRDSEDSYVYFAIHHFICDGWSLAILLRDLAELYLAHTRGRRPNLPPLAVDYPRYVQLQRRRWDAVGEQAMAFWRKELAGCTGRPAWPSAGDGPPADSSAGATLRTTLEGRALDTVYSVAAAVRTTPFVVLMATTAAAIADVTGATDLLFDTDAANREEPARGNVIGFLLNTRLTGVRVPGRGGLAALARTIDESWRSAEPFRDIYGGNILDGLGGPPTIKVDSSGPHGVDGSAFRHPRLRLRRVLLPTATHHWREIMIHWRQHSGGQALELWHRPSRVPPRAARDVVAAVERILR